MKSYKVVTRLGWIGSSTEEPYPEAPYEVSIEPQGEVSIRMGRDCTFEVQGALRTWSDGSTDVLPGYYQKVVPNLGMEGHDICPYCGTSNGLHGEFREGYDCYQCGGN